MLEKWGGIKRNELCLLMEVRQECGGGGKGEGVWFVLMKCFRKINLGSHRGGSCVSGGSVRVRVVGQLLVAPPQILKESD